MIDLDAVMRALKAIYETLGDEAEVIILVVPPPPKKKQRNLPNRGEVLKKIRGYSATSPSLPPVPNTE